MENPSEDSDRQPELSYRLFFERNPLPMWVYDVQSLRILAANLAALTLYGYSKEELVGLTLLNIQPEDDAVQLLAHLKLSANEQPAQTQWLHRHRNGDLLEVETVTENIELDGVCACLVVVKDMTEQRRAEQSHMDLAYRLNTTLESISDAFFTLDRQGRFTYVSARAEELLHSRRDDLVGCSIWEKFPESVGTIFQSEYERAIAGTNKVHFESYYPPFGMWLEVEVFPSALGVAVNFRDVTDKHAAEQRLIEERETLAAVIDSTSNAIISIDSEGNVDIFNPGAEHIFRRSRESMRGQIIELLLPERFRSEHQKQRRQFAESGGPSRMMGLGLVKGLRSDDQEIDLEGTIARVSVLKRQMLIVILRDVTERVRADAGLEHSRAQLSELTQRLMTQEKTLVKRLAQALHDQLGQTMAAIRMAHETIITLQKGKTTSGIDNLQAQMGILISQAIRQVRQVLIDLRPPLLEEHGLAAALDNELRNRSLTQPQLDISISVRPEVASLRWPSEVEYAAFMVAREAVENALRHASATSVSVRLTGSPMSLQLEVLDNGVGMAGGATLKASHLGILGMHERANLIGATVTIGPGLTAGTRVRFSWKPAP
jgi:hypothetical protein